VRAKQKLLGLLILATLAIGGVAYAPPKAESTVARSTVTCAPIGPGHHVNGNRTGYGVGFVDCQAQVQFNYTVRLYNASGGILGQNSGTAVGSGGFYTPTVGCAGAWVHGFIYSNYNGQGLSNTETSADFC
jgi:hypothetical protein